MNVFEQIVDAVTNLLDGDLTDAELTTKLDQKSKDNGVGANWKVSIVDLLNLVGIDSSSENRTALAAELGVVGTPGDAAFNTALLKRVLESLKERGGNVPANLID